MKRTDYAIGAIAIIAAMCIVYSVIAIRSLRADLAAAEQQRDQCEEILSGLD